MSPEVVFSPSTMDRKENEKTKKGGRERERERNERNRRTGRERSSLVPGGQEFNETYSYNTWLLMYCPLLSLSVQLQIRQLYLERTAGDCKWRVFVTNETNYLV